MDSKQFSAIKEMVKFCKENGIDSREVYDEMVSESEDFEVNDWRFIHTDSIDKIQQEELESDEYILGCFNAWFLSDILDAPISVIESAQKHEDYETLGTWVIESGKIEELQEKYSSMDGYGNHFSHYDGNEYEVGEYYAFRLN